MLRYIFLMQLNSLVWGQVFFLLAWIWVHTIRFRRGKVGPTVEISCRYIQLLCLGNGLRSLISISLCNVYGPNCVSTWCIQIFLLWISSTSLELLVWKAKPQLTLLFCFLLRNLIISESLYRNVLRDVSWPPNAWLSEGPEPRSFCLRSSWSRP